VTGATERRRRRDGRRREHVGGVVAIASATECRRPRDGTSSPRCASNAREDRVVARKRLIARFDPTCESLVVIRKKATFGERRGRVRGLHTKIFSLPKFTTQSLRGARFGVVSDSRSDHASRKRVLRESRK
jgi:hypothetical protein